MLLVYHYNDNFPIILGLSKGRAISWLLKTTSATSFTMRSNRERLPGDAPLPPDLMNIYSKEMVGKKSGRILFEWFHSRLDINFGVEWVENKWIYCHYRTRSEGDNVLGSVRPSVCPSSVRPLTAEPFDLRPWYLVCRLRLTLARLGL